MLFCCSTTAGNKSIVIKGDKGSRIQFLQLRLQDCRDPQRWIDGFRVESFHSQKKRTTSDVVVLMADQLLIWTIKVSLFKTHNHHLLLLSTNNNNNDNNEEVVVGWFTCRPSDQSINFSSLTSPWEWLLVTFYPPLFSRRRRPPEGCLWKITGRDGRQLSEFIMKINVMISHPKDAAAGPNRIKLIDKDPVVSMRVNYVPWLSLGPTRLSGKIQKDDDSRRWSNSFRFMTTSPPLELSLKR